MAHVVLLCFSVISTKRKMVYNSLVYSQVTSSCLGGNQNNLSNVLSTNENNDENHELQVIRCSSYYDIDKFTILANSNTNSFSILSSNIQSINAKFNELEMFLEDLRSINFKFSVICLQETWKADNDDFSQFFLDGYDCITQGKKCSNKGGLLIYVDNKYKSEVKMNLNTYEHWEGLMIKVTGNNLSKTMTIGNIYIDLQEHATKILQNSLMNFHQLYHLWKIAIIISL